MMNDNKTLFGITIDKHVSVGHIATTVALIITSVLAYANMVNRIYNLELSDVRTEEKIVLMRAEHQNTLDKIFYKLERIDEKLDSKVDKK